MGYDGTNPEQSIAQIMNASAAMGTEPQSADTGQLQAGTPPILPQLSGNTYQPPQGPPQMGGVPLIVQYLQGMIKGPRQGMQPAGTPNPSRGDMTLGFLGQFLSNLSQGLAQAGHGPGANLRGFAGAVQAPYQRSLQDWQVSQEAQRQQSEIAKNEAQAELLKSQSQMVQTPYGMFPAALAKLMFPALIRSQTQEDITSKKLDVTQSEGALNRGSKEKIAADKNALTEKSLTEKANEFKTTDAYRKWKTSFDNDTKLKVAAMTANKAPAAMLQTASFADGALNMMDDAEKAMQSLETRGVMGSLPANKVQDWIFGKGLVDPTLDAQTRTDIGKLRAALGYTSSAAMRAHTGRTSQEIYGDFKNRLGAGQDWNALRGAMDETRTLMTHYRDAATNSSIQKLRGTDNKPTGPLSMDEAQEYLRKAGGNKDVARKMAKADGRTF